LDLNSAVNLRRSLPLFIFLILFGDKNITYSPGTNFGEQYIKQKMTLPLNGTQVYLKPHKNI
jgi:hypothetical protein